MIDIQQERLIPLKEACRAIPLRRRGRPIHPATIHRWGSRGVRGVRLETIQVGGTLCTSVEALQRFFERLTDEPQREGDPR